MAIEDKSKFYLANSVGLLLKSAGSTVLGSLAGFGTGLSIYLFAMVGFLFKGMFTGDAIEDITENHEILKAIGQGLTDLPGIGLLFKPFVSAVPYLDSFATKAVNFAIKVINKVIFTTPAIQSVPSLGFFGWIGLMLPFIISAKPVLDAKNAKQSFIDSLDEDWKEYAQEYKAYEMAVGNGIRDANDKPEPPKDKELNLEALGAANETFSLKRWFYNPIKWLASKLTLGWIKAPNMKSFSSLPDNEKVLALYNLGDHHYDAWVSTAFVGFAGAWYSALLTNKEDEQSLNRYLTVFSVLGAGMGLYHGFNEHLAKVQEEWKRKPKPPAVGLEQEQNPAPGNVP